VTGPPLKVLRLRLLTTEGMVRAVGLKSRVLAATALMTGMLRRAVRVAVVGGAGVLDRSALAPGSYHRA